MTTILLLELLLLLLYGNVCPTVTNSTSSTISISIHAGGVGDIIWKDCINGPPSSMIHGAFSKQL